MPQFYVHLAGEDRDNAFLKMNGMQAKSIDESPVYTPQGCPRCRASNAPDAKLCNACGLGLDIGYTTTLDARKQTVKGKLDTIADLLAKSPEVPDSLLNALERLKSTEPRRSADEHISTGPVS